jgi:hypothetical protein
MDNGEEFTTTVDDYQQFVARGSCYLGVANDLHEANACAIGVNMSLSGWATRGLDLDRQYSVRNVWVDLGDLGLYVGRESGSNFSYPEEFGWVLDYSSGHLIGGVGTQNRTVEITLS